MMFKLPSFQKIFSGPTFCLREEIASVGKWAFEWVSQNTAWCCTTPGWSIKCSTNAVISKCKFTTWCTHLSGERVNCREGYIWKVYNIKMPHKGFRRHQCFLHPKITSCFIYFWGSPNGPSIGLFLSPISFLPSEASYVLGMLWGHTCDKREKWQSKYLVGGVLLGFPKVPFLKQRETEKTDVDHLERMSLAFHNTPHASDTAHCAMETGQKQRNLICWYFDGCIILWGCTWKRSSISGTIDNLCWGCAVSIKGPLSQLLLFSR